MVTCVTLCKKKLFILSEASHSPPPICASLGGLNGGNPGSLSNTAGASVLFKSALSRLITPNLPAGISIVPRGVVTAI